MPTVMKKHELLYLDHNIFQAEYKNNNLKEYKATGSLNKTFCSQITETLNIKGCFKRDHP